MAVVLGYIHSPSWIAEPGSFYLRTVLVGTPKKQVAWTPHQDPYKRARAQFAVAHMSNAKWRKVLRAIADADLGLTVSESLSHKRDFRKSLGCERISIPAT